MEEADQSSLLREWYKEHQGISLRIARANTRSLPDQEDLIQEISLQIWNSIPNFRVKSKASTWIYLSSTTGDPPIVKWLGAAFLCYIFGAIYWGNRWLLSRDLIPQKRFAEDLVELLSKMGHQPDWNVTLGLKRKNGRIKHVEATMTEHNRNQVRDEVNRSSQS